MKTSFTRMGFYDLIWSTPLSKISNIYSIPYLEIVAICEKHRIPRPDRNYWSSLKYSKTAILNPYIPLPNDNTLVIQLNNDNSIDHAYLNGEDLLKAIRIEIESDVRLNLIVPKRLSNPHNLIKITQEAINRRKIKSGDRRFHNLDSDIHQIPIRVGDLLNSRALRFLDCLIKNIYARGHSIEWKWHRYVILLHGEDYTFSLREVSRRIKPIEKYMSSTYEPTGILAFNIDGFYGKEWRDTKTIPLEDRISEIIAKLEMLGREERSRRIYRFVKQRKSDLERLKVKDLELIKSEEDKRFKELLKMAKRWKKAQTLREFLVVMKSGNYTIENLDHLEFISWAYKRLKDYDPLEL
jgi:hypothetical protein